MPSIGKYEILEQLGSGSMGTVHKGRDKLLDRMVALKMIRTGVNIELEAKERFYREARTCARLSHPHIVSVYDLGEENGTSFIAMELLKGADFRQLIERREPLPLPVKLIAMAQICEGLAHAHREGVIHRDIKPSNLFLLGDGRAKIVDFGIAKLPTSHLTRSGAVLGTPNYMAPEQIQGLACDGRADLFSAGICFFEFLTFHHPFQGNLIPQRILEDNPDSLFQWDPSLPRILERIFAKALAKKPENRYATGDEFAADLRTVVDAVTLNSSPTFTNVELPSASSFAVPPTIPATEAAAPRVPSAVPPPSSGTASGFGTNPGSDWRATRIQQLLPILDGQFEQRDLVGMRSSLAEFQSVAGLDPRFRDALEHYRARMGELDGSQTGAHRASGTTCPKCGANNRPNTAFCITCGTALPNAHQTGPVQPMSPRQMTPPPQPPPPTPVAAKQPEKKSAPAAAGFTADKKRLVYVAAFVVIVIAALIFVPGFFRDVKVEPFVATARVASQQGILHSDPNGSAKSVASVSRSTLVNVLSIPKSLTSGFVQVQARDGDSFTRPGYIQTVDLIEWDSKDPKIALNLARLSGPMENGTDAEIRSQIDRLNSVAATFNGKPEASEAGLDALRLQFALIKRNKEANPAGTDWPASLTDLLARLQTLRSDPAVQSGADDLIKQVRELLATAPNQPAATSNAPQPPTTQPVTATPVTGGQVTPPAGPATPDDLKKWMQTSEYLRKTYDYKNALFFVQKVLKADPANSDAKKLQEKIKAAIDLENSAK